MKKSKKGRHQISGRANKSNSPKVPEYGFLQKPSSNNKSEDSPLLIRLNSYIAKSGICSRRDADELIKDGKISVNGTIVTELGTKVGSRDSVKYDGQPVRKEKLVYILLNKPKNFITTTKDPEERHTVMELVANACQERLFPVGRLDRNTTGLLLLTNDGDLADSLSHPSNKVQKLYQVELNQPINSEILQKIRNGITLEDGEIQADEIEIVTNDRKVIGIELHSGKNRIVRRIFEFFGYKVTKLDRVMYADLTKIDLPRGKWRYLKEKEVVRLKYMQPRK